MTHEERAKQLKWKTCPHDPNTGSLSASMCDTCLAEQFREVDRETREEPANDFAKKLAGQLYHDLDRVPSIETVEEWKDAVAQAITVLAGNQLRAIVAAGDALRRNPEHDEYESYGNRFCRKNCARCAAEIAWDEEIKWLGRG